VFADIKTIKAVKNIKKKKIAYSKAYEQRIEQATARATLNTIIKKNIEAFINSWTLEIATLRR
jgi:hypothetical protein